MKKIYILFSLLFYINQSFAQNSAETIVDGTKPVFRAFGFGTSSEFTQKASILGQTGTTSSSSDMVGVFGFSNNSTNINYGLYGYANGATSLENIGVYGLSKVFNSKGYGVKGSVSSSSISADYLYGGEFTSFGAVGINGSAVAYGAATRAGSLSPISAAYGIQSISNAVVNISSYGISATSAASGSGAEFGGLFLANGNSTGTKTGVSASATGSTSVFSRYGVRASTAGPAITESKATESIADNPANGTTYGGYFQAQGSGTGTKYGIYATTAGSGSQVAAALIGKVGINTEVPVEPLTVYSPTNSYGISNTDGTVKLSTFINSIGAWFGTKSAHPLYFYTNDSGVQAALLNNGNFGIGFSNPTEKLHVSGNIKASGNLLATGTTVNNLTVSTSSTFSGSTTFNNTVSGNDANFSGNVNIGGVLSPDVLNIGGLGSAITKIKRTTITGQQIFGVVNNTCDLNNYYVPGVAVGDNIILNIDSPFSTLTVANVRVSAVDQVEVKFCNIGFSNTVLLTGLTFRFMYYR